MRPEPRALVFALFVVALATACGAGAARSSSFGITMITRVVDGDTVDVATGARVRLVQIDTPEVYNGTECYGPQASAATERLVPPGTRVRLLRELSADDVDRYGRLLRYVIRVRDGLDVNIQLVRIGAAAPYFYDGQRGRYASLLDRLARAARREHLGLWGHCPGTPYEPTRAVSTGPG